jgi:RNA polymerase sigma-70 factor (ECF subfamily)
LNPAEKTLVRPEHPTLSSGLLDGARRMDSESWSRLVNTFGPIVYGWCRTSGVPESDAADIVQNVFVSVAKGISSFEHQKKNGSFRSWLATITRNRIRDHFRRQAHREVATGGTDAWQQIQRHPDELADELDSTICPETASGAIHRRVLDSVRAEFEATTWQAFWFTAVEGKTAAEAAETIGISISSIYQSKSRVLRRLRQRLTELPE